MGFPGGQELILILVIVIILFGAKKIPELAKGLGSGIKEFKKATQEDENTRLKDNNQKIEDSKSDNRQQ
ncbi:MAG: twin-arginine translocase TatA/TatE family subunit [Fibrobacterota bacterium]